MILKVVATLVRQSKQNEQLLDVKKLFLSDMTLLCNNNRENRRTVLQMSVWQEWLIAMAYIHPKNAEEQKISDMVYSLFRMLLHHAVKHEYGGWRVWVDTLAIVHSKVSYEEFKLQFAQMYEHYERQRSDNITDPAVRQQRPISTISGWERQATEEWQPGDEEPAAVEEGEKPAEPICSCDLATSPESPASPSSCAAKRDDSEAVSLDSRTSDLYSDVIKVPAVANDGEILPSTDEENSAIVPVETMCNGIHGDTSPDSTGLTPIEDVEVDEVAEMDKTEIVERIVQEILAKSERLLEENDNDQENEDADNEQEEDDIEISPEIQEDQDIVVTVSGIVSEEIEEPEDEVNSAAESCEVSPIHEPIKHQKLSENSTSMQPSLEVLELETSGNEREIFDSDLSEPYLTPTDTTEVRERDEEGSQSTVVDEVADEGQGNKLEEDEAKVEDVVDEEDDTTIVAVEGDLIIKVGEVVIVEEDVELKVEEHEPLDDIQKTVEDVEIKEDSSVKLVEEEVLKVVTQQTVDSDTIIPKEQSEILSEDPQSVPIITKIFDDSNSACIKTIEPSNVHSSLAVDSVNVDNLDKLDKIDNIDQADVDKLDIVDNVDKTDTQDTDTHTSEVPSVATIATISTICDPGHLSGDVVENVVSDKVTPSPVKDPKERRVSLPTSTTTEQPDKDSGSAEDSGDGEHRMSPQKRPRSASTSTQVDPNLFGKFYLYFLFISLFNNYIHAAAGKRTKSGSSSTRPMFSPGPTRPPFRIPEFKWSYIHQRLLSDVLFSLETDIQVWRSHSTKSVLDFVNSSENAIFVVNTVHLISQLADNLIIACGGLLPLLASATSPNVGQHMKFFLTHK